jgi:hypothetical protein
MCDKLTIPIYPISTTNETLKPEPFELYFDNSLNWIKTTKIPKSTEFDFSRLVVDFHPDYCVYNKNNFTDTGRLIIQKMKAGPLDVNFDQKNVKETYFHFTDTVIPVLISFEYDTKKSPENMNLSITINEKEQIKIQNYFATNSNDQEVMVNYVQMISYFKQSDSPFFQQVLKTISDQSKLSNQIKIELNNKISESESNNPNENYKDKMDRMKDIMDVILK